MRRGRPWDTGIARNLDRDFSVRISNDKEGRSKMSNHFEPTGGGERCEESHGRKGEAGNDTIFGFYFSIEKLFVTTGKERYGE